MSDLPANIQFFLKVLRQQPIVIPTALVLQPDQLDHPLLGPGEGVRQRSDERLDQAGPGGVLDAVGLLDLAELTVEQGTALGPRATRLDSLWAGAGCDECRGTGYRGRTGIYELLVMDDALRDAVQRDASAGRLEALAVAAGMTLLQEDGLRQVRDGTTTVEEVLRVASL